MYPVQEDYNTSNSSSTSSLIATSIYNTNNEKASSESSENEEYETLPKEPYEDKYIKLTSVNALEFLPSDSCTEAFLSDTVLSFVHKTTHLIFIWCFVSSICAALLSMAAKNRLILLFFNISWATFYFQCAAIWAYCFYCFIKSNNPLKDWISRAKHIAMVICTVQALVHFSTLVTWNGSDLMIDDWLLRSLFLSSASENFLSYGSVLSVPAFVLLEQFYATYQRENFRKYALLKDERDNAQRSVYMAIDRFSERKGLYLRTISDQLRQTTDLAMDILKQLSPSHLLTKPHEQLSACSMSFPTASISAIHTTLKAINYISSHLGTLSYLLFSEPNNPQATHVKREFDIGELIQYVADSLAGVASRADVELVVYHVEYEYGLNHLNVIGDEAAFRHVLLSLIKCILSGASPGACIELGLQVRASGKSDSSSEKERVINPNDKVACTIEIIHNLGSNASGQFMPITVCPDANLTFKVLSFLGATLKADEEHGQQRFEITIELNAGSPLAPPNTHEEIRRRYPHSRITGEPSVEELKKTTQSMRGQKVALHATSNSFFAKRITSCLTTWGTDISHVPIGGEDDLETPWSQNDSPDDSKSGTPAGDPNSAPAQNNELKIPANSLPPKFIIIDDDIDTLKNQLLQLRNVPFAGGIISSTNQKQARVAKRQIQAPTLPQQTTAVIHFTSLTNYKHVKDTIQCYIGSPATTGSFTLPQVLVIPKPAGPRRFITALHTTINRIVVDPVYMPIATSPMSPDSQNNTATDVEVNPMDQITNPPDDNYFSADPTTRPSTPSIVNSNRTTPNSNPLSPRPSGRVLVVVPKSKNSDRSVKTITSVNNSPTLANSGQVPTPSRGLSYQTVGSSSPNGAVPDSNIIPESVSNDVNTGSPGIPNVPKSPTSTPSQPAPPVQSPSTSVQNRKKSKNRIFGDKTNSDYVIPPINVLIVEDNPINQAILSTFMRKKNIKYECATNGQEAVDKWKKGGFHLILMDIQLPVMDGIEATKTIRRLEKSQKIGVFPPTPPAFTPLSTPLSETSPSVSTSPQESPDASTLSSPVIIMALTASSLSSDRQNALAAGCNDFLTKPVSLEWLEKKINEWGCMQVLIDFDGWRRWKKVGEEISGSAKAISLRDQSYSSIITT